MEYPIKGNFGYKFELENLNQITILTGDVGTGKTELSNYFRKLHWELSPTFMPYERRQAFLANTGMLDLYEESVGGTGSYIALRKLGEDIGRNVKVLVIDGTLDNAPAWMQRKVVSLAVKAALAFDRQLIVTTYSHTVMQAFVDTAKLLEGEAEGLPRVEDSKFEWRFLVRRKENNKFLYRRNHWHILEVSLERDNSVLYI
jgi:hypothetical protein